MSFVPQFGITGSFDSATGQLNLSGQALLSEYESVLHSIAYKNTSDSPSAVTRTISFAVNDGELSSNLLSRDIEITAVNDAPVLSNIENGPAIFIENSAPLSITSAISTFDADDSLVQSATVSIGMNFSAGQDLLQFTDQAGIVGSYNPFSGTLQLTGSATPVSYTHLTLPTTPYV